MRPGLRSGACLLVMLAAVAQGRDTSRLEPADGFDVAQLSDKVVAIARRTPVPQFLADLADPSALLLSGNLQHDSAGTSEYEIQLAYMRSDPAKLLERNLALALQQQFPRIVVVTQSRVAPTNAGYNVLFDTSRDAEYVLDVFSHRIMAATRKRSGGRIWMGYGVQVRLLGRSSATPVFSEYCFLDTADDPDSPTMQALAADHARLYYETLGSLAWKCLRRVAANLKLPPESLPPMPAEFTDPLRARGAGQD